MATVATISNEPCEKLASGRSRWRVLWTDASGKKHRQYTRDETEARILQSALERQ